MNKELNNDNNPFNVTDDEEYETLPPAGRFVDDDDEDSDDDDLPELPCVGRIIEIPIDKIGLS